MQDEESKRRFLFDPPRPFEGEWPDEGTPEAQAFDNQIRPLIQAMKFVPDYRSEWNALEGEFGRRDVLQALGRYRKRRPGFDAIQRRLHDLAIWTSGYTFEAVDPHDLDDFGVFPGTTALLDTWWFLRNTSVSLRATVDEEEYRRLMDTPGCLLAIIDLTWPDSEIAEAIKGLRKTYGPKKPTIRPKARRAWIDGGEGLREAFQALEMRLSGPALWKIGRDVLKRTADTEETKRSTGDAVRRLLKDAERFVAEMAYWHRADRASPIPKPPLIHLGGE